MTAEVVPLLTRVQALWDVYAAAAALLDRPETRTMENAMAAARAQRAFFKEFMQVDDVSDEELKQWLG